MDEWVSENEITYMEMFLKWKLLEKHYFDDLLTFGKTDYWIYNFFLGIEKF